MSLPSMQSIPLPEANKKPGEGVPVRCEAPPFERLSSDPRRAPRATRLASPSTSTGCQPHTPHGAHALRALAESCAPWPWQRIKYTCSGPPKTQSKFGPLNLYDLFKQAVSK